MTDTILPDVETSTPDIAPSEPRALTPHVEIRRVVVLVNPLSGSVGPRAADEVRQIMTDYPCEAEVVELVGDTMDAQIDEALASEPDVLFVLAGDGTARAAASKAGPKGPLVSPLPGGTMNMLPKALYGTTDWKAALRDALENGSAQCVSGGVVEGQAFYCAGIFGSPALWAPAREAMRTGKLSLAWTYGRRALRRAFSGKIRVELDLGKPRRSEALVLISPMISRALQEPVGLEAAAMNLSDMSEAFRLAANAVFSDWRQDPSVVTKPARLIRIRGRSRIPAVLDGEPVLLPNDVTVAFRAKAFQALVPEPPAAEDSV
ncbi:diacylglycerol kinase family protein [Brevundimonas staleyi]|uniref:Diacylglycerol/lipid kinase family protein n=1 Tax=Brevundimonas staleyi TaxID=74326 RepID=A0ABW0FWV9_9CAUL